LSENTTQNTPYRSLIKPLIVLNVIIYGLTLLLDKTMSISVMDLGAKVNWQIADGQWYRLLTPMFLHWNLYHLFSNMLALYILGPHIEALFGRGKFLALYLFAGYLGNVLSFTFSDSVAAGASGAIFGIMGAHLYLFLRNREVYNRLFGRDILMLIALNIGISIYDQRIDLWGHAGGLLGGIVIAWLLQLRFDPRSIPRIATALILTVAISAGAYTLAGMYSQTDRYYFFKTLDLAHQGHDAEAMALFRKGQKEFPLSTLLQEIQKSIDSATTSTQSPSK